VKRLQYHRYGGPEVMRLAEYEPPRPDPDEVLVRAWAAVSNALDWKMRNGEMNLMTVLLRGIDDLRHAFMSS
jgi:NADPH:quinone reductase-like Zn-dependent oxidoreductase